MSTDTDNFAAFNPAAMWREWVVKSEAQWSDALSQLMKDPSASGAMNKQVGEAQMMHRQFGEAAQAALAAAYLPSRADIEAIDERMGRLEDGLAQLGAEVVALRHALVAQGVAKVDCPPRTRRAPKSSTAGKPATADKPATAGKSGKSGTAGKPGKR